MISYKGSLIPQPLEFTVLLEQLAKIFFTVLDNQMSDVFTQRQLESAWKVSVRKLLPSLGANTALLYLLKTPLHSMTASGRWGNFIYVTRNGKTYLKRFTKPYDPDTISRNQQKSYFQQAVKQYQLEDDAVKEYWRKKARTSEPISGFNLYISALIKALRNGESPGLGFME